MIAMSDNDDAGKLKAIRDYADETLSDSGNDPRSALIRIIEYIDGKRKEL